MKRALVNLVALCALIPFAHAAPGGTEPSRESRLGVPVVVPLGPVASALRERMPSPLAEGQDRKNIPHMVTETIRIPERWEDVEQTITKEVIDRIPVDVPGPLGKIMREVKRTVTRVVHVPTKVMDEVIKQVERREIADALISHRLDLVGLDLTLSGDQLVVRTVIDVRFSVKFDAGPEINIVSVGEGEPPAQVVLTLRGRLSWADDGRLCFQPDGSLERHWNREARVTAMEIDVEDILKLPIVRDRVQARLQEVVGNLHREVSFRGPIEQAWLRALDPIALDGGAWLQLRPRSLSLSAIRGDGPNARFAVGIALAPLVTAGPKPERQDTPLAAVAVEGVAEGVDLTIDAQLSWASLSSGVQSELAKDTIALAGLSGRITHLDLSEVGGQLLALVQVEGERSGVLTIQGTLSPSPSGHSVAVTDIAATATSDGRRVTVRGTLLDRLARRWTDGLEAEMSKVLAAHRTSAVGHDSGSRLSFAVDDVKLVSVRTVPSGLGLVVELSGRAEVEASIR